MESSRFCVPSHIQIGERQRFAIEVIFPEAEMRDLPDSASAVLAASEGYLTFYVGGRNILALKDDQHLAPLMRDYTLIHLVMFLEWVSYDMAYRPDEGTRLFSDMVCGDFSPPIEFSSDSRDVLIRWNLQNLTRCRKPYMYSKGEYRVELQEYVQCLAGMYRTLVAAIGVRAVFLGCNPQWQKWLQGHEQWQERLDGFVEMMR